MKNIAGVRAIAYSFSSVSPILLEGDSAALMAILDFL